MITDAPVYTRVGERGVCGLRSDISAVIHTSKYISLADVGKVTVGGIVITDEPVIRIPAEERTKKLWSICDAFPGVCVCTRERERGREGGKEGEREEMTRTVEINLQRSCPQWHRP